MKQTITDLAVFSKLARNAGWDFIMPEIESINRHCRLRFIGIDLHVGVNSRMVSVVDQAGNELVFRNVSALRIQPCSDADKIILTCGSGTEQTEYELEAIHM